MKLLISLILFLSLFITTFDSFSQPADIVNCSFLIAKDTPEEYKAIGTMMTADMQNPPNGLEELWCDLPTGAPAAPVNWNIQIRHMSGDGTPGGAHYKPPANPQNQLKNRGGFIGANLAIRGTIPAPAAGAAPAAGPLPGHVTPPAGHVGEGVNNLPLKKLKKGKRILFSPNPQVKITVTKAVNHRGGAAGGPAITHRDHYSATSNISAMSGRTVAPPGIPWPPNMLAGATTVQAIHRNKTSTFSFTTHLALFSLPESGSTISFDANTGLLSFNISKIDVLMFADEKYNEGNKPIKMEEIFEEDLIVLSEWFVSEIKLVESDSNSKKYKFSKGDLILTGPNNSLTFEASFDEFFVYDSSSLIPVRSFAILDSIEIFQDQNKGSSDFLNEFISTNIHGETMTKEEWALWRGIDFAFHTKEDLVKITNGFTKSVKDYPATYIISVNSDKKGVLF